MHDTIRIDKNAIIYENNIVKGGHQHTKTMEVLHDENSVIMSDSNSSEKLAVDFVFHQSIARKVRTCLSNDILLDSESSCSIFNNKELL